MPEHVSDKLRFNKTDMGIIVDRRSFEPRRMKEGERRGGACVPGACTAVPKPQHGSASGVEAGL